MAQLEPTRRSIIRAGAWTAPVIVVVSAVPAFAASGSVRGTHQATDRTANRFLASGTCTNDTGAAVVVTVVFNWLSDATGPGAGSLNGLATGTGFPNGWTYLGGQYYASGGSSTRGIIIRLSRTIASGATVPLPSVGAALQTAAQTGDQTITFEVPAGVPVVQPAPVRWPAFGAAAAGRGATSDGAKGTTSDGPKLLPAP